ncbi:hypothetical protein FEE96_01820 [Parasedimentitalea maritima]|uniref:NAD(P)-binding domain-containing protein n=1 Tax=Parasedimentitalea maritima TaxID=2578117 RepID=A0ABY2V033_9RHOB|nr:hypothetical protein [Zongyanglinia marina]TLP69050.1 hypothetical protein FEE96_01820 [Zongyanglinia marina]
MTCKDILRNCGIDFTLIRSSRFAQNFSEGHPHGPVLQGAITLPAGQVQEPIIVINDIAEVAIRLTSHLGRQPSHYCSGTETNAKRRPKGRRLTVSNER